MKKRASRGSVSASLVEHPLYAPWKLPIINLAVSGKVILHDFYGSVNNKYIAVLI